MAGTQAWMMRSWLSIPIWLWISINGGALVAGMIICVSTLFLVSKLFLPLFLNSLYFGLALWTVPSVTISVTISLIQWLVLRERVIAPVVWSLGNVIIGLGAWILFDIPFSKFIYRIAAPNNNWVSLWDLLYLLLSILMAILVGVFTSTLINTWGRP
jgi:hypothetical protein